MAAGDEQQPRIKKRGVRASRVKLERALAEADLEKKTQAALADRIADLEELDAAPKDLVSKVFRERFVDPQTLERVARALGVEAEMLYLEETAKAPPQKSAPGAAPETAGAAAASKVPRAERIQIAALFSIAFLLFLLFMALAVRPAGPWCGLREAVARPHAEDGKLGIVIARFADDPENRAQQYLAASLAGDQNLAPYASVLATCARPRWSGPGDLRRKLLDIRARGRRKLESAGAHLMLWGDLDGDDLIVRFISTRRDVSAFAVEAAGRPLKVQEANIELRVPLGQPSEALAEMKRLALELIAPGDPAISRLRSQAMQSYNSSADWLRAAVVSQRNLRRTLDPKLQPQRWAAASMQLCYDLRLLGDYEGEETDYRQALKACDDALAARPRERFPHDWGAIEINKASALIRLHYFEPDRDSAIAYLHDAEAALQTIVDASGAGSDPQQRATAQRNLGVLYVRLGELAEGAESSGYFDKAVASSKAALAMLDPDYQPLDWAITQQNVCLALYQHGARLGADGVALMREAKTRCKDAVDRLSTDNSPVDWAMAQNNLAAATAVLAQTEGHADGLAEAIDDFTAAQTIYTRDRLPENWAEVEINLGELHCNLAIMRRDPKIFETALSHLDSAIEVFIDNGNARYQRYAEKLISSINACNADEIESCTCGG